MSRVRACTCVICVCLRVLACVQTARKLAVTEVDLERSLSQVANAESSVHFFSLSAIFTARRYASAAYAVVACPSAPLSVRPSVSPSLAGTVKPL